MSSLSLHENLSRTEQAIQEAQVVKPDAKELEAIKQYCSLEVKLKRELAGLTEKIKDLKAKRKQLRDQLTKDVVALCPSTKCISLSKDDMKRLEQACSASGIPCVPAFLRIVRNNKDTAINPDIVQEAIECITQDDLEEASKDTKVPHEIIKSVIVTNVRRIIRSYTENLKLLTSVPKGLNIYEITDATTEVANRMHELWTVEQEIKSQMGQKKVDDHVKETLDTYKEKIETFFARTGLTAQRIVVEGNPYRLVRRLSVRKQRIGIGKFETFLDEVLKSTNYKHLTEFRPQQLIYDLQICITSVPPESKTSISLCAVKVTDEQT
jgi:hypothetical protein